MLSRTLTGAATPGVAATSPRMRAPASVLALASVALAAAAAAAAAGAAPARAAGTERVSVATSGGQAGAQSFAPSVSGDGRFVAFASDAADLVPGDTNGRPDVFVRDRRTDETRRVSVGTGGSQADGVSFEPAISGDGRFVAFTSDAADLVADDANGRLDVFVRDRRTGATERVSLGTGGAEGDGDSFEPAISADGRFVAFTSRADDLVAGDTNGLPDTFVRDRQAGATRRVNVGPGGAQADAFTFAPAISGDGRFVAFQSEAATLVAGDTNGAADVFVRDQRAGATERVSVSSGEVQGDGPSGQPSISADGRRVAFTTRATNLVPGDASPRDDVLVRDRRAGTTRRVNVRSGGGGQANGVSSQPAISADGRVVAFLSSATNLVRGDTNRAADVFVRDLATGGATRRASVTSAGGQGDGGSNNPAVSGDGRSVAFDSTAANLVAGDSNGSGDVFVRTR